VIEVLDKVGKKRKRKELLEKANPGRSEGKQGLWEKRRIGGQCPDSVPLKKIVRKKPKITHPIWSEERRQKKDSHQGHLPSYKKTLDRGRDYWRGTTPRPSSNRKKDSLLFLQKASHLPGKARPGKTCDVYAIGEYKKRSHAPPPSGVRRGSERSSQLGTGSATRTWVGERGRLLRSNEGVGTSSWVYGLVELGQLERARGRTR